MTLIGILNACNIVLCRFFLGSRPFTPLFWCSEHASDFDLSNCSKRFSFFGNWRSIKTQCMTKWRTTPTTTTAKAKALSTFTTTTTTHFHMFTQSRFSSILLSFLPFCQRLLWNSNNFRSQINFHIILRFIQFPTKFLRWKLQMTKKKQRLTITWLVRRAQLLLLLTLLWLLLLGMDLMLWSGLSMCWVYCQQFSFCGWAEERKREKEEKNILI